MLDLEPLLRARSVAVVGASPRPGSFGCHVLRQLLDFGYSGRIVPVNPRYDVVEGLPCLPRLADLGESVDCAAICVGDERLEMALADAIAAGARSAVVFGMAAGKPNAGPSLGDRLRELAVQAEIPLMGANCMGFFNFSDRLLLTGYPYHRQPQTGFISFITHSGSTLSAVAKNTRGMNFNYVISPGQELVVSAADYLQFAVRQPETKVVGLFLETVRDPVTFRAALDLAFERDIPVVMLKVGRTEHGARMALAHTGALAGSHGAITALANRYSVILVRTIEELFDTLELMATGRRFTAPGFAAITDSGGERSMMVDLAADIGLSFAELSPATLETIRQNLDPGLEPANPADLWGSGGDWQAKFRRAIDAMVADTAVGAFNFGIDFNVRSRLGPDYRGLAIETTRGTRKPVAVVGNVAAGMSPDDASALRTESVPVLMGAETGLLAFRHLRDYSARHEKPEVLPDSLDPTIVPDELWRRLENPTPLTESEGFRFLELLGVPSVSTLAASSLNEAKAAVEALGYPVVLKTAAPGILHKSDAGGVVTGLSNDAELTRSYAVICKKLGSAVIVQPQVDLSDAVELLLGMTVDAQFGPLVTIGLGGIWVETIHDALHVLAPCSAAEVTRRLPELKGFSLLTGVRNRQPVDLDALAGLIERFSVGAATLARHVAAIDINPLVARGSSFLALDVLIIPASADALDDAASRG